MYEHTFLVSPIMLVIIHDIENIYRKSSRIYTDGLMRPAATLHPGSTEYLFYARFAHWSIDTPPTHTFAEYTMLRSYTGAQTLEPPTHLTGWTLFQANRIRSEVCHISCVDQYIVSQLFNNTFAGNDKHHSFALFSSTTILLHYS